MWRVGPDAAAGGISNAMPESVAPAPPLWVKVKLPAGVIGPSVSAALTPLAVTVCDPLE